MGKTERVWARIGLAVGGAGFVLLALAQLAWAFAAAFLLALVGLAAGLATAKWLPRALYGKQLVTGARAGALACAVAALGLLISLALAGGSSVDALARRSHLLGLELESAAHALRPIGWLGIGLLLALAGIALGTGLAALAAQLAAWDKNQRAIQVIERAREAAQRSTGRQTFGAAYSGQGRRPTGVLPVLPGYPPLGQTSPDLASQQADGRAGALHEALAAWADSAPRAGSTDGTESAHATRDEDPTSRPGSDRDNWLC